MRHTGGKAYIFKQLKGQYIKICKYLPFTTKNNHQEKNLENNFQNIF